MEQLMEEVIWINAQGYNLDTSKGSTDYLEASRQGREFVLSTEERQLIIKYVNRVVRVVKGNTDLVSSSVGDDQGA